MKILGNGVDIIKNSRIEKAIKNKKFIYKIYSNEEILIASKTVNKSNFYANRFAAKEAFMKALGTGNKFINFKDISVKKLKSGKPKIIITKKIKDFIKRRYKVKKFKIFVSLSDEKNYSIAYVIINTE